MEEAVGGGLGLIIGLLIIVAVGAVIGWLASLIVKGSGLGLWEDVLVGIGGSAIAGLLFPTLGLSLGDGFLGAVTLSVIGAVLLLLVIKLVRRA